MLGNHTAMWKWTGSALEETGETLGEADDDAHYGLEHFGFDTDDIEADIERLVSIGAVHKEGPLPQPDGRKIGFIGAPGGVRIELIQPAP